LLVFGGLGVSGQINAASLQTSGNAVINGNLQFKGVGTFGDAITDTITSLARYISDLLPSVDNSYDLGNNSLGWRNFRISGVGTIATLQVTSITAGVWGGTAISAVNGGTGQNTYAIGDILYASSTTALAKLAAGTAGSVLKSNGAGTAPSWQADATGSGGAGTVAAPTASNLVAYYPGTGASVTSNSRVSIDTANSTVEIDSQNSKSALILNAVNGSISNLAEFKNSFGDVLWSVGATAQVIRGFGSSLWLDSASTLLLTAPAALSFYNTDETFATSLTGSTNATTDLTFILPITAGTAGSVLTTAGASGQLYWSAPGTGGGGAGTVAVGTSARMAYYPGTGASVSGAANFTYNTTSVIVANTTASNNNSSGALLVYGGIGASGQISGAGASFTSTVYLNGIQIGQGGNNINILDSSGATIANFNTSNGWFRSAQTTQSINTTTGALVSAGGLGVAKAASIGETIYGYSTINSTSLSTGALVVSGGAGIAKTMFVGDNINIFKSGSVGALRLWNSATTFYTGLQAGVNSANVNYTLPAADGSNLQVLYTNGSGGLGWTTVTASGGGIAITAGTGITFSTGVLITTSGTIRAKRPLVISFCSGYTPTASGADTNIIRIPDSPTDGTTALTYIPREFHIRVETPSAGTSTIQLEKYTGTSAFSGTAVTVLSITGGAVYEVQSSVFANAGLALTSGDKMRINFTALNATHANFSVTLELEEF
jgi:hypothetical protein